MFEAHNAKLICPSPAKNSVNCSRRFRGTFSFEPRSTTSKIRTAGACQRSNSNTTITAIWVTLQIRQDIHEAWFSHMVASRYYKYMYSKGSRFHEMVWLHSYDHLQYIWQIMFLDTRFWSTFAESDFGCQGEKVTCLHHEGSTDKSSDRNHIRILFPVVLMRTTRFKLDPSNYVEFTRLPQNLIWDRQHLSKKQGLTFAKWEKAICCIEYLCIIFRYVESRCTGPWVVITTFWDKTPPSKLGNTQTTQQPLFLGRIIPWFICFTRR